MPAQGVSDISLTPTPSAAAPSPLGLLGARALSAPSVPGSVLRSREGAAADAARAAERSCPRAADPRPGARVLLPPRSPLAPGEGQRRAGWPRVTFHGHGLQDAELLEDGDEQQHHHGHGAQLHALEAHGGPGCLGPGRAPRPRAASGGTGAGAARPASWGGRGSHAPGRRGCGCRRGRGPRRAAASWGPPGGWTRRGGGARAQLSESAGKLRGAAGARSAARAAGASQRRLHARRGCRASFGPSPALRGRGRGGAAAAAAGVPGTPGRPSLHRGSPRAHWPRRADHPGRSPLRRPPARARGRGGGRRPRPARSSPWTEPGAQPPLPGQPPGGRAVGGFPQPPVQGWGPGPARKGAGHGSLSGVGAPLSWLRGAEPGHRRSPSGPPAQKWPSEDPGSPLAPGYFPQLSALGRRLNLALVWPPLKMEKLVSKLLRFWKAACTPGLRRERGLWH